MLMMISYLKSYMESLKKREDGVTMIEYGLLAALIAVALILTIKAVSSALDGTFGEVSDGLSNP